MASLSLPPTHFSGNPRQRAGDRRSIRVRHPKGPERLLQLDERGFTSRPTLDHAADVRRVADRPPRLGPPFRSANTTITVTQDEVYDGPLCAWRVAQV